MSEATETDLAPIASAPPKRYRILPEFERNQIIAKRLHGLSLKEIAKQHDINPVTVWRLCRDLKKAANDVTQSWREEQVELAIQSVNRALVDDSDTYKSANIGVQALKGLGVYAQDNQVSVNVANWLSSKPVGCDELEESITTTACDAVLDNGAGDGK